MVDKKEVEPVGVERVSVPPEVPTVESPRKDEQNLEVESWMKKIERRLGRIPRGKPGAQDDTVVVQAFDPAQAKQPPVQLPVNQQQLTVGQKAPVETGLAWLVSWALRRIKMLARLGRRVMLRDIPEVNTNTKEVGSEELDNQKTQKIG